MIQEIAGKYQTDTGKHLWMNNSEITSEKNIAN